MHHKVRIDGVETELRFQRHSPDRGYQYLTRDNRASHGFQEPLQAGQVFRTNGHHYEVLT